MKTLVVIGHPKPNESHVNVFLKESVAQIEEVIWHVLANRQIDVEQERALLKSVDRIILQFPIYWYSCPSLLKEWIDTVFSFQMHELEGKEFGIVALMGGAQKQYQAGGKEMYTVSEMLRPFEMLARHLKMTYLPPLSIHQFSYMSEQEKQALLVEYMHYTSAIYPMTFQEQGKWYVHTLKKIVHEEIQTVIDVIEHNQEELEELQELLKEMM
ncbi:NAD(P)H-dependent oxidoreductase [Carnobacteriaceae bacterium zg-84]|uniref:NAD(P)H-dependent oxidoreductase n=1 Tax=Granulicatella sp. zg-84 TaxID=2678503 RepID=UPI0013C1DD9E|nr:NAD(P)H-dependent oxidoreductase [Granulicatella sp. zg-84]NEW65449.1 flavodoxin family protein [Granulicatella sp. zg-84]QMI85245.1 NAD(P)H-dependent oxidoreductase [Carnobacteriaceae bacterium zg-84]